MSNEIKYSIANCINNAITPSTANCINNAITTNNAISSRDIFFKDINSKKVNVVVDVNVNDPKDPFQLMAVIGGPHLTKIGGKL